MKVYGFTKFYIIDKSTGKKDISMVEDVETNHATAWVDKANADHSGFVSLALFDFEKHRNVFKHAFKHLKKGKE